MRNRTRPYDNVTLRQLQEQHTKLVQRLLDEAPDIRNRLDRMLRIELLDAVHLVHSCDHFPIAYGLNRFLVLLIAAHLNRPDLIISGKRTHWVSGILHQCRGTQYELCYGRDHTVGLVDAETCWEPRAQHPAVAKKLEANIVIIRHGIDANAQLGTVLPDIPVPRQALPYIVYAMAASLGP